MWSYCRWWCLSSALTSSAIRLLSCVQHLRTTHTQMMSINCVYVTCGHKHSHTHTHTLILGAREGNHLFCAVTPRETHTLAHTNTAYTHSNTHAHTHTRTRTHAHRTLNTLKQHTHAYPHPLTPACTDKSMNAFDALLHIKVHGQCKLLPRK
jgi:hypothetical protein